MDQPIGNMRNVQVLGIDTVSVSDCHMVLGYLNPDNFLGGAIKLDRQRSIDAIKVQVADPLGLSVEDAAASVIELLDSSLRDYLRAMISGKGYNPSSFVCFSYGGAGPVHAYGYTEGLGFEDVIVPAWAAGFSAFGCAAADFEYCYDKSLDINLPDDAPEADRAAAAVTLQAAWEELTLNVLAEFELNGYNANQVTLQPGFRMQYRGQLNDLKIESPLKSVQTTADWDQLANAFNDTYGRVYAAAARSPELGFSVTGAIMRGSVPIQKPKIPKEEEGDETPPDDAFLGTRKFYRKRRWMDAKLYRMESLHPGNRVPGCTGQVQRFGDGYQITCRKVGENDVLFRDWLHEIQRMVRTTRYWILDERTRIAGCHMIRKLVEEVVAEAGIKAYWKFAYEVVEHGRQGLQARIKAMTIPGKYRQVGFVDVPYAHEDVRVPSDFAKLDTIMHAPSEITIRGDGTWRLDFEGASRWGWHTYNAHQVSFTSGIWVMMTQTLIPSEMINDGAAYPGRTLAAAISRRSMPATPTPATGGRAAGSTSMTRSMR